VVTDERGQLWNYHTRQFGLCPVVTHVLKIICLTVSSYRKPLSLLGESPRTNERLALFLGLCRGRDSHRSRRAAGVSSVLLVAHQLGILNGLCVEPIKASI
jgi:hypothetical protein